ncbi:MAG: RrF2 family transcriptional regulator [Spirochaetota bacterium]
MVRISKTVEYALVVLKHMDAHPSDLVSARDLRERYDLPGGLLAKIMQRLASGGLVESVQGAHGGYRLVRDPAGISLLELSEAVEGPVRVAACDTGGTERCERGDVCTVAGPVHSLSERIVGLLSETNLGTLLSAGRSTAGTGVRECVLCMRSERTTSRRSDRTSPSWDSP